MTDENTAPKAEETAPEESAAPADASPPTGEPSPPAADMGKAWDDVLAGVNQLSDALGKWAKAAADDPENRRRLDQVRAGMDDMSRQAESAFNDISSSEFGAQVRQGAQQVGEAAQRAGEAAAPHVAAVFGGLAEAFGTAADKVGESARRKATSGEAPPPETAQSAAEAGSDDAGEQATGTPAKSAGEDGDG